MNGVKHYVKYLVNECINRKKKLFICEITIYIYIYIYMKCNVKNVRHVLERYQRSKTFWTC